MCNKFQILMLDTQKSSAMLQSPSSLSIELQLIADWYMS